MQQITVRECFAVACALAVVLGFTHVWLLSY